VTGEGEKLVECPNCAGDGFQTDAAGITTPCPVCEGEGEVSESVASKIPRQDSSRGAPKLPWEV
jgi:DnaJ-class molecular chaperone